MLLPNTAFGYYHKENEWRDSPLVLNLILWLARQSRTKHTICYHDPLVMNRKDVNNSAFASKLGGCRALREPVYYNLLPRLKSGMAPVGPLAVIL